ncbi:MAG TPA: BTAD domain-containing putative transcriptional regulator [Acidimicrobiia bacterium]|nr:BTAD domain-containing putative transcriptional regulator [Acidimicrobiia bacterium]
MSSRGLQFQLLGRLGVRSEIGYVALGSPKQRAVLAILLLHANEIVPTDRIIDLVWGDSPPRTAEHSVQIYISNLRKILAVDGESGVIETRPPGYLLSVSRDAVDALRFERLAREGLAAVRSDNLAVGRLTLEKALATWTATPLAEFVYDDFAQGYIRALKELRSDAVEVLAAVHLEQGNLEAARDLARQAIEADPLREEPHRVIILSLYHSGRQAEALRHYGEYKKLISDELGLEPSEGLRHVEERVLLQDPSLSPPVPSRAGANPYRGLQPFSEEDAEVYFGRESLVSEVVEKLDGGSRFVSIVGPSGSGKSSAAQAGLIPLLRARGETVVLVTPGPTPLRELASALDRAGFGAQATLLRRFHTSPESLAATVGRPTVLIIDQFEELFMLADTEAVARFSQLLSFAVEDHKSPLRFVATLRADHYDKPLSVPSLAGFFSDSVVSVKPMTAEEIERAVVEPARVTGVEVEPALLAQLVADMRGEPGALPIFQFALFELFERASEALTLTRYQDLGGLQGALTFAADELLGELDDEGREVVEQVMLRMVRKSRSTDPARRPVPVRDLLDLGMDPVALQAVLDAFGSRRLLTFDREASGAAVVQIAHEYLLTEWPQLASWIEAHSEDLDRIHALDASTEEWIASDRSEDYLLVGERLKSFEGWRSGTRLRLTKGEEDFLDASIALRDRPQIPPAVVLWGVSDEYTFGRLIRKGLDQAAERHGVVAEHLADDVGRIMNLANVEDRLSRGTRLVVLTAGRAMNEPVVGRLIEDHPESVFLWLDWHESLGSDAPRHNEAHITSRNDELGFLAGVAAAHKTAAGRVGIVIGMDAPFMHPYHEGFEQGVSYVDSGIDVSHVYLSRSADGFASETLGGLGARSLIHEGADVVFHAAGQSGVGVFEAIHSESVRSGRWLWAIGIDEDEHAKFQAWKSEPWASQSVLAGWQSRTLTSIVKRIDVAVFEGVDNYLTTGEVGDISVSIESGGIDYTKTGGFVDDIVPVLEAAKNDIRNQSYQLGLNGLDEVRHVQDLLAR